MNEENDKKQPGQQVNISINEKEAEGIYSNLAIISHSNAEFIIDFTRLLPGVPSAKVHARIIMTPIHAKLLSRALAENVRNYEAKNGEIRVDGVNNQFPDFPGGNNFKVN